MKTEEVYNILMAMKEDGKATLYPSIQTKEFLCGVEIREFLLKIGLSVNDFRIYRETQHFMGFLLDPIKTHVFDLEDGNEIAIRDCIGFGCLVCLRPKEDRTIPLEGE